MNYNWITEVSLFVDENKREFQLGLRSVAFAGLLYALRSIRPIQKFKHASNIPQSFIDKKLKLNGSVIGIECESSVVLRVDHKPIIGAKFRKKPSPGLAVSICSLNVSSNGVAWLQHVLLKQNIQFLLLKRLENELNCIIYHQKRNVAEELIKLGFATVLPFDSDLEKEKIYLKYYQSLLKLEDKAEKSRLGVWADTEYTTFEKVMQKLLNIIYYIRWKF